MDLEALGRRSKHLGRRGIVWSDVALSKRDIFCSCCRVPGAVANWRRHRMALRPAQLDPDELLKSTARRPVGSWWWGFCDDFGANLSH